MTNNKQTDVKRFTKKPVTISAIQWTGDNLPDVIEFTGKHPRWGDWFADMGEYIDHVRSDGNRFKIFTLEGVMDALPGDWIIRGVQGEHYPCKQDIFAATYDPAELQERRKADSEPAAWKAVHHSEEMDDEVIFSTRQALDAFLARAGWWPALTEIKPLYAAPQPAPVVPEECPDELLAFCEQVIDSRITANAKADELWSACRAAMLQGSQPVSNRDELPCAQVKAVADLYALCWQSGEVVTYTPDQEKATIWLNNYSGTCVQEYVTLERFRSVVSGNSPVTVRR